MIFYAIEVSIAQPSTTGGGYSLGWGTTSWGALTRTPAVVGSTATLRASDVGYRTLPTDPSGPIAYPPTVSEALSVTRAVSLDPARSNVAASWGAILLANDGTYDAIVSGWNVSSRATKVFYGSKTLDTTRNLFLDPAYATLTPAFVGLATPWFLTDTQLQIPLRDATYWLEAPVQPTAYLGTGTYEGTAAMTGTLKPRVRGTVYNIAPVLIDPVNLIYQYTDAAGTVAALYEGGATNITFSTNTTNLYAGSTPAGQYRTDNSRGMFQLGSSPVGAITLDATGNFPIAGFKSVAADIARYILSEDMAIPAANLNTASFTTAASTYNYAAGIYMDGSQVVSGVDAVDALLSAFGAALYPARDGTLRVFALRAPTGSTVASYTTANTVSVTPRPLPATVSPPAYRVRVAYQHNYTVQTSGLLGAATATRKQFIAAPDRYAAASSNAVLAAYARPNDVGPVGGALTSSTDAQAVANGMIALWGARRRLYDVVVPMADGLARDFGDIVSIVWPLDDLANGQTGVIVGDSFRSSDATLTLTVLV